MNGADHRAIRLILSGLLLYSAFGLAKAFEMDPLEVLAVIVLAGASGLILALHR